MHDTHAVRHGSLLRAGAVVLAATMAMMTALLFTTQTKAHAAPLLLVPAAAYLPAAIAGTVTTGAALTIAGWEQLPQGVTSLPADYLDFSIDTYQYAADVALGAAMFGGIAVTLGLDWLDNTTKGGTTYDPVAPPNTSAGYWTQNGAANPSSTSEFGGIRVVWLGTTSNAVPASGTVSVDVQRVSGSTSINSWSVQAICRHTGGSTMNGLSTPLQSLPATFTATAASLCTSSGYAPSSVLVKQSTTQYFDWRVTATTPPTSTPAGPSGTAVITTTPESTCANGATVVGTPMTFTGSSERGPGPITYPACPAGVARTGGKAPSKFADGSTAPSPVPNFTAPIVPSAYAECNGVPSSGSTCVLTLLMTGASGETVTCNNTGLCLDYARQMIPEKVTTQVGTLVQTQTMPDGTTRKVTPATLPSGATLRCQWGPYTIPVAGCGVVPLGVPKVADPTVESNCRGSDLSFNPVSWVVVPLKCLFIPRDSQVQAAASALGTAWDGTAPAVVVAAAGTVFAPVVALGDTTVGDCQGPPFTFPALAGVTEPFTIHPMSTCNELATYLLGIYLPVASAMTYLGGFFAGTRLLLKSAGAESPVKDA